MVIMRVATVSPWHCGDKQGGRCCRRLLGMSVMASRSLGFEELEPNPIASGISRLYAKIPRYSTASFSSFFRFSISLVGPLSLLSPRLHLVPSKLFSSRHVPPFFSFAFFLLLRPLCSTLSDYCGHTGNIRGEKHPFFRLLAPLTLCPPGIDLTFRSLPISYHLLRRPDIMYGHN